MMCVQVPNTVNPSSNTAPLPSLSDKKKRGKLCIEEMEPGETLKSIAPQKLLCQICGYHFCQKDLVHICDSCNEARF